MQTEIEAKFPDIDLNIMRQKLNSLGAVQEHPERLMRRKNFDYPDQRLEKIGGWVRVRDEGNKVTLSYKQLDKRTIDGMKEINLVVDDFEKTCSILAAIGLEMKAYQETKREAWSYKDIEIAMDTWPWIPAFVELEGRTEKAIKEVASALGLNWKNVLYGSVEVIYQMHYDFSESEIDNWKSITFVPHPDWLLARKK